MSSFNDPEEVDVPNIPPFDNRPMITSYEGYVNPLAGVVMGEGWFESKPLIVTAFCANQFHKPSPMNSFLKMAFIPKELGAQAGPAFVMATDGFSQYAVLSDNTPVASAHVLVNCVMDPTQLSQSYLLSSMAECFLRGMDCGRAGQFRAALASPVESKNGTWVFELAVAVAVDKEVVESALLLDCARGDAARAFLDAHFPEKDAAFDPASALLRFSTDNMEPN